MKKLIILFVVALISVPSFGQQLHNQFYFRLGYSSPSWSQFGLSEQEWNSEGFSSKAGACFEMGNIFMINSILDKDNMAIGINVDYLYVNYNSFSNFNDYLDISLATGRVGSKVGPSFTYSPAKKLALDLYAKADFAWATATTLYEGSILDADDYYTDSVSFGFSGGLNIRFGLLMLGIEYNTVSPELESDDHEGVYLQNLIDEMAGKSSTGNKSDLPCWNFTAGITF